MKKIAIFVLFILLGNLQPANAVDVLPEPFFKYLGSKYLANPGVILIDGSNNQVVYQSGAFLKPQFIKLRKKESL